MNETPVASTSMDQSAPSLALDTSAGTDAGGKSDQICRDYQRGVCSRADKCKFAHPDGMGTEPKDQPMICRDFQNGTCNRSTCKYLHVNNIEEKVYMRTGQLPEHIRTGGSSGPPPRGPAPRGDSGLPICKDFLNNKCNRGSGCKFRHVQEDDSFGGGVSGGGGGFYNEPPRKRPREGFESDYRYLMEENVSLRRKVSELQKEVSDLRATNDVLLEQNARYRRAGGTNGATTYGGGYATDDRSRTYSTGGASSVSYPSRESYPPAVAYNHNAYTAPKPGTVGQAPAGGPYDGYTKFE